MSGLVLYFFIAFTSCLINYACVFQLPHTNLIKDPLNTLGTALPLLIIAHTALLIVSLLLKRAFQISTVVKALIVTLIATGIFHVVLVLFGASIAHEVYNTLLFAAYLAVITVMAAFQTLSPSSGQIWVKVYLQHAPTTIHEIYAYTQVICALIGSWVGAIVLPLDWETDWQKWPISCVVSTFLGHLVGVIAGFVWSSLKLLFGKKKSE
ncbi:GPI biosynthesis protein Pig-F [Gongronella butleri]|nr:GPI biosynthesis protein Pig-F [Gongronella butleri]